MKKILLLLTDNSTFDRKIFLDIILRILLVPENIHLTIFHLFKLDQTRSNFYHAWLYLSRRIVRYYLYILFRNFQIMSSIPYLCPLYIRIKRTNNNYNRYLLFFFFFLRHVQQILRDIISRWRKKERKKIGQKFKRETSGTKITVQDTGNFSLQIYLVRKDAWHTLRFREFA